MSDNKAETIDINKFCSTDKSRIYLTNPWEMNGFAYATDGHLAIRIPCGLVSIPGITEEAEKYLSGVPGLIDSAKLDAKHWIKLLKLPEQPLCKKCNGTTKAPKETECPECEGTGEAIAENDYHEYEVECKTCDGDGEVLGDGVCKMCRGNGFQSFAKPVGCDVRGARLNLQLLGKIKDLPGLKIGIHGTDNLLGHYFEFDQGDGLIMPLRLIGEKEDEVNFTFTAENYQDCEAPNG